MYFHRFLILTSFSPQPPRSTLDLLLTHFNFWERSGLLARLQDHISLSSWSTKSECERTALAFGILQSFWSAVVRCAGPTC